MRKLLVGIENKLKNTIIMRYRWLRIIVKRRYWWNTLLCLNRKGNYVQSLYYLRFNSVLALPGNIRGFRNNISDVVRLISSFLFAKLSHVIRWETNRPNEIWKTSGHEWKKRKKNLKIVFIGIWNWYLFFRDFCKSKKGNEDKNNNKTKSFTWAFYHNIVIHYGKYFENS